MKLNYGSLILLAVALPIVVMNFWGPPWTVQRIAGLAIAVPSFILFAVARIQLGKAFSVQATASTLVTTGIYSRIRNPIYVFGSLTAAGFLLWVKLPWLLLFFVILLPLQVYRSRKEALVLVEKFGSSYLTYKRQTWF